MSRIGSVERPLTGKDPARLARGMAEDVFRTEKGRQGLWWWGGVFWVWNGGKWKTVPWHKMEEEVFAWLADAQYVGGDGGVRRVNPGRGLAGDVTFALQSLGRARWAQVPTWADGGEGKPRADRCIGFQDVVVSVEGGVTRVVGERDETWVDPMVVPCCWDPEAKAERWQQVLREWGEGDEGVGRLLQRWTGYGLLGHREYRKWLLLYGPTGTGKGTYSYVRKALMGAPAYLGMDFETLAGDFGLGGLRYARVLDVNEVSKLDGKGGEKVARVVKNLVGGDPVAINEKYEPVETGVVCRAQVTMSSNQIPKLPNQGQGLSAKMLVVPFTRSFDRERAEWGLKERLVREELAGIAAWAVEGARQVEAGAKGGEDELWPRPRGGGDVEMQYRVMNNPMAAFLEARFVPDPTGFVAGRIVRAEWNAYKQESGEKLWVSGQQLLLRMEQEGGWHVARAREGGLRGLRGVVLKKALGEDL